MIPEAVRPICGAGELDGEGTDFGDIDEEEGWTKGPYEDRDIYAILRHHRRKKWSDVILLTCHLGTGALAA